MGVGGGGGRGARGARPQGRDWRGPPVEERGRPSPRSTPAPSSARRTDPEARPAAFCGASWRRTRPAPPRPFGVPARQAGPHRGAEKWRLRGYATRGIRDAAIAPRLGQPRLGGESGGSGETTRWPGETGGDADRDGGPEPSSCRPRGSQGCLLRLLSGRSRHGSARRCLPGLRPPGGGGRRHGAGHLGEVGGEAGRRAGGGPGGRVRQGPGGRPPRAGRGRPRLGCGLPA